MHRAGTKRTRQSTPKGKELSQYYKEPCKDVWCTVELVKTDGSIKKEYVVKSSYLETEWGEKVSDRDLFYGNQLIWKCKGACYEVSICGTHREKPLAAKNKNVPSESDVEEQSDIEVEQTQKKKKIAGVLQEHDPSSTSSKECSQGSEEASQRSFTLTQVPLTQVPSSDDSEAHDISNNEVEQTQAFNSELQTPITTVKSPLSQGSSDKNFPSPFSQLPVNISPCTTEERLRKIEGKIDIILKIVKKSKLTSRDDANREDDSKYITEAGINLIQDIRASNAGKYALQLMDIIFTDEEMASSIYEESSKSKNPGLDHKRVAFLEDCIKKKFGEGTFKEQSSLIKKKCTQKCIDKRSKRSE